MKEPSHALRSLQNILSICQIGGEYSDLRTPLMCNIDYLGHRIQCLSTLPILKTGKGTKSKTLVYGSDNAGDRTNQEVRGPRCRD